MNPSTKSFGRAAFFAAAMGLAFASCSRGSETTQGSKLAGEATFDPRPSDPASIEAQLKRFPGQTQFLTPVSRFWAARDAVAASGSEGSRAIQESDVFKIGKPGDKVLFLLNNYRGLQVVSFAEGADEPKVLGRVEATGNWPTDMYFDAAHDRLIVLENNYTDNDGNYYDYSELQSRLVVYDVSNTDQPRIAKTIDVKGTLADSRMVGDVLYVATSVRPAYNAQNQDGLGYVQSFALADDITTVETVQLSSPVGYGETMNIVTTTDGDATKYYLVAVLSQSTWSWWDRQSLVEVIDISDEDGDIRPLMQVTTRGVVRERSQTHVKNGALVVASNYTLDDQNIQRIAVESFSFPKDGQLISKDEAEYRRLHIERAEARRKTELVAQGMGGDALVDALAAYRIELQKDAELGLYGRFVTGGDGLSPVKLMADHAVTVGDTQGLSANIQDVRVDGDLMYVFWVPANNIDPLDVFDISAPAAQLKHLAHLEFDGWIQRAMPVTYAGKHYILGLGWIVPSVDNDNGRRYPQVALFEIKRGERLTASLVAQENLAQSNTWANFNGADKDIEFRFDTDAAGVIMYTFYGWADAGYTQGGKLIGFDLSQVGTNNDAVFTEGGVLAGGEGWLRRVFSNPEIARINTFADTALGVYDLDGGIGAADRTIAATKVLELARNIRGYTTVKNGDKLQGVQIVSDYGWSYDDAKTELRLVAVNRADAELKDVTAKLQLNGYFVDQATDASGRLVVLTSASKRVANGDDIDYFDEMTLSVIALSADGDALTVAQTSAWTIDYDQSTPFQYERRLVTLANGQILALGAGLRLVDGATITNLTTAGCAFDGVGNVSIANFNGVLGATYSVDVLDPNQQNLSYERHFFAPAGVEGSTFKCGTAINVPGKAILARDGHIVTEDTRLLEIVQRGAGDDTYQDVVTDTALASVATDGTTATLIDLYDPKDVSAYAMKQLGNDRLVFVESKAKTLRFGWFDDMRFSMPRPGSWSSQDHRLVYLGFDDELRFTKASYTLGGTSQTAPQISALLAPITADEEALAFVMQGSKLSALGLKGMDRPTTKRLAKVGADFVAGEPATHVSLTGYARYWLSGDEVNLTLANGSIEIADGLFGVTQILLVP